MFAPSLLLHGLVAYLLTQKSPPDLKQERHEDEERAARQMYSSALLGALRSFRAEADDLRPGVLPAWCAACLLCLQLAAHTVGAEAACVACVAAWRFLATWRRCRSLEICSCRSCTRPAPPLDCAGGELLGLKGCGCVI